MALSAITLGFLLPSSRRRSSTADLEGETIEEQEAYYERQDRSERLREEILERRRSREAAAAGVGEFGAGEGSGSGNGAGLVRGDEGDSGVPSYTVARTSRELGDRIDAQGESSKGADGSSQEERDEKESLDHENDEIRPLPAGLATYSMLRSGKTLPRTVTITEDPPRIHRPIHLHSAHPNSTMPKGKTNTTSDPYIPPRSRPLPSSLQKVGLFRSWADDWHYRHDSTREGFWRRMLRGVMGTKENDDDGDERGENWIPAHYRWTPILSGLIIPFSM